VSLSLASTQLEAAVAARGFVRVHRGHPSRFSTCGICRLEETRRLCAFIYMTSKTVLSVTPCPNHDEGREKSRRVPPSPRSLLALRPISSRPYATVASQRAVIHREAILTSQ
jgi:hypothetical protein